MKETANANGAAGIEVIREALEAGFAAIAAGDVPRDSLTPQQVELYDKVEEEMSAADADLSSEKVDWRPSEQLIEMYRKLG